MRSPLSWRQGLRPRGLGRASGSLASSLVAAATIAGGTSLVSLGTLPSAPVLAQGTPSLMEFRWDNTRDFRKLTYFITSAQRLRRSEYYLVLRPKDRKTAILKLAISIPEDFDVAIKPSDVKLCYMSEGGMLARTECKEQIPALVEVTNKSVDIFPERPVSDKRTIGVYMNLFNPFNIGMYQFNALAQAPGDVPISGYLGSWVIQIDPPD
jgi:hypothetical protein